MEPPARSIDLADATDSFSQAGSPEHVAQADALEGALRPEGHEVPDVDLAKLAKAPDELTALVEEVRGGGGDRTPDQILADIKKLLAPPDKKAGAPADPVAEARAEFQRMMSAENAIRDALVPLTDLQKVALIRRQYPDAYATLNRLSGPDLDDAIVARVMAGEVKLAKRGPVDGVPQFAYGYDARDLILMFNDGLDDGRMAAELTIATGKFASPPTISVQLSRVRSALKNLRADPAAYKRAAERLAVSVDEMDGFIDSAGQTRVKTITGEIDRLLDEGVGEPAELIAGAREWARINPVGVKFALAYGGVPVKIPAFDGKAKLRELLGEPSAYLPWRNNPAFKELAARAGETIDDVPVAYIVPGQSQIRHNFKDVKTRYGAGDVDLPQVVRENGKYYIRDGTHRIADQVDDGATTVRARITDLDAAAGDGPDLVGMSREDVISAARSEFGDNFGSLFRLGEVNISDYPPAWADPLTQGLTDGQGRVVLFAANISPDEVRGLVLHELGVHSALPRILGQDGFDDLLTQIDNRLALGDDSIRVARSRVPEDTPAENVLEETLAYLVENAPRHSIVQRLFADIRAWLFRTFPMLRDQMVLTDADLQSLALGAVRGRIREADWSVAYTATKDGAPFAQPVKFAGRPRPVVTPSDEVVLAAAEALTKKEFEVWKAANEGLNNEAIALRVGGADGKFSPQIVSVHLTHIRRKGFDVARVAAGYEMTPETRRVIELRAAGLTYRQIAERVFPEKDVERAINNAKVIGSKNKAEIESLRKGAVSTGPIKYARRSSGSENPESGSRAQVSGGAGRLGRPDVRGGARAGEDAARGGAAQSGASPARAVVTQQIPQAPFVAGRWNDRVDLSPEQRADRRAQFRDFVEAAEFDVEMSRGLGDFRFKGGKRTGERGAYEQLVYTIRQPEDAHASWADALDPETTRLEVEIHGGEATIPYSRVGDDFRSTGLGQKMYMKAIDDLLARALVVNSDVAMSDGAVALWKSLRRQGYDVIQRVPDSLLERGLDRQLSATDDSTAIFFIARKKPGMPELPMSTRDVTNAIDEARALAEHMPACVTGKP